MLFRIFSLVFILWLLKRILAAILNRPKPGKPWGSPTGSSRKMVKDPVCGMYMDPRLAVRLDDGKEVFYFCSEECKKKYVDALSEPGTASSSEE